jgi:hypothetical protein
MSEAQMKKAISPAIHVVSNSLTVIQFMVILALLYVAFKMGRNYVAPVINNHTNGINTANHTIKPPKAVVVPQAKKEEKISSK